jgi:NAD(P)-dependent dehydrogenase (short-subunit alcohol dehydrogenase family)
MKYIENVAIPKFLKEIGLNEKDKLSEKEKLMMYGLEGKVAIVTGGSRGIGKDVAGTLGKHGCKIAVLDIEDEIGVETVKQLNEVAEAVYFHCDISNVDEIKGAFQKVVEHFGCVDILINNAGIPIRDYIKDIDESKWDKFNSINVKSVFFFSQIVAEHIKERNTGYGRIVNLSSIRAKGIDTYHAGYCITKSAVNTITKTFAVSYGKYGITSNAVALGFVLTPMTAHYLEDKNFIEMIEKSSPIGRAIETWEVADTIAFFTSKSAGAISGQVLMIDGGGVCAEGIYQ